MQPTIPTIRVQGQGRVLTTPDVVVLSLAVGSEDRDYGKAVAALNTRSESLRQSLGRAGEDGAALKTTHFSVTIQDDYVDQRRVFRGFVGDHRLQIRLPFEQARLAKVFAGLLRSEAKPELSMAFSVSDPETIQQRVLEDAVKNAQRRAEIIAAAAREKLGRIVAIEYGYAEIRVSSEQFALGAVSDAEVPEMEPSDIESSDTVQITWEIEAKG